MSGIFTAARPLTVSSPAIPQVGGEPALVPLKLSGVEAVNSLFEYTLTLQTPDALNYMGHSGTNFDLKAFIGRELTCSIELEGHGQFVAGVAGGSAANQGAGVREISGIITGAKLLGEDAPPRLV
jgi:type VI secretion system secreted protein VgrG